MLPTLGLTTTTNASLGHGLLLEFWSSLGGGPAASGNPGCLQERASWPLWWERRQREINMQTAAT
jgi:hypothetical protein